jgi:hypothetical protein
MAMVMEASLIFRKLQCRDHPIMCGIFDLDPQEKESAAVAKASEISYIRN